MSENDAGPALRWEERLDAYGCTYHAGISAAAWVATVAPYSGLPDERLWTYCLLDAAEPCDEGVAESLDAAEAAAEAAFRAWCHRAGLVARVGFVPPYKAAGGPGADGSRTAEGGGAERDAGGGT